MPAARGRRWVEQTTHPFLDLNTWLCSSLHAHTYLLFSFPFWIDLCIVFGREDSRRVGRMAWCVQRWTCPEAASNVPAGFLFIYLFLCCHDLDAMVVWITLHVSIYAIYMLCLNLALILAWSSFLYFSLACLGVGR